MLDLSDALRQVLASVKSLPSESIPLAASAGRILAKPITAPFDLPRFDNSAMDGYAVRAEEVVKARAEAPVCLRVIGQVAAGEIPQTALEPGACVRVFTGSALPPGADAVVMQEDTVAAPNQPEHILVVDGVQTWEHVRLHGEDLKADSLVAARGERLGAGSLSLLASLGLRRVQVSRQPVVALLATGSELIDRSRALKPGKIYESNRVSLGALLQSIAAKPRVFPLVPDDLSATHAALEKAFAESDAVITTGGASVGELDLVKQAFEAMGGNLDFWKIAIRPGKPFVYGHWGDKCFFGLPGNPVSALVTFLLLVRPALLQMQGATHWELPAFPGVLAEPLRNPGDRCHFMRVIVDQTGQVCSAGRQGSHVLSSLAKANGLVEVAPFATLLAGTTVRVPALGVAAILTSIANQVRQRDQMAVTRSEIWHASPSIRKGAKRSVKA